MSRSGPSGPGTETCARGRGNPASTITVRVQLSPGSIAPRSPSASTSRNCLALRSPAQACARAASTPESTPARRN
ncbi:MAG TPA: hypothetical protein VFU43_13515 [Streptosporangiaceae bacterium]|nr:hypothetical protein [Streptosporangiaceae bacterium]